MGFFPSVNVKTEVIAPTTALPYLHHPLITCRPPTTESQAGFLAATGTWVFRSPVTLEPLVVELGPNNYQQRLKSMGFVSTDHAWRAVDAVFKPLSVADPVTGIRTPVRITDKVYLGRRTSAVVSSQTITFATNTAGRTTVRVNPSQFIFPDTDDALVEVTVVSDGVDPVGDLATDLAAQLNGNAAFAALYSATATLGAVEIESLVAGYPLIVDFAVTTPGPSVTLEVTTANVANAYRDDLFEMQAALAEVESNALVTVAGRKVYFVTDLQFDDVVNAEGMAWVENQADTATYNPPRDYQYLSQSSTGGKTITLGGDLVGNFDPNATDSAAQVAAAANGGTGWTRSGVHDHDRWEFMVCALLGRTVGFRPGEVSFNDKVLYGSTANARMTPRSYGTNDGLTATRKFNTYGDEGPRGAARWGYTANGSYVDRKWLEDYSTYLATQALINWKQRVNIVTYTDDDIESGAGILAGSLAPLQAIVTDSIEVTYLLRREVDPNNIAERVYLDYTVSATAKGVINMIGTLAQPISITISEIAA